MRDARVIFIEEAKQACANAYGHTHMHTCMRQWMWRYMHWFCMHAPKLMAPPL